MQYYTMRSAVLYRAVGVTTVLTVALFYGKIIIIHIHNNNNNDVII